MDSRKGARQGAQSPRAAGARGSALVTLPEELGPWRGPAPGARSTMASGTRAAGAPLGAS
eukprot:5504802-Pyramimonas_sp.AAC.1